MERFGRPFAFRRRRHRPRVRPARRHAERQVSYRFGVIPGNECGPKAGWHPDPARQLVITLTRALEFTTHDGRFSLRAGDVLFTEDTVAGHDWTLLGDQPWRRLYAILDQVTVVPFRPTVPRSAIAGRETRTAKAATTTGEGI